MVEEINMSDHHNQEQTNIPVKETVDPQKPIGWWQYFVASNATTGGSVVMLIVGLGLGFPWGYYVKYKLFKSDGAEIVNQSLNNQRLDDTSTNQMERRSDELNQDLRTIGFSQSEIKLLLKGNTNTLGKLKNKFNSYVNDDPPYQSRIDCDDDYLGRESSNEVNQLINDRFNKRIDGNE